MKGKISFWLLWAALQSMLTFASQAEAQRLQGNPQPPFEIISVQGNVYLIPGAGGNVTVQIGDDGILLVDSGAQENAQQMLETVSQLSDLPIRRIVNTHIHEDHTGGNAILAEAGQHITYLESGISGAGIYAHESVLHRMSGSLGETSTFESENWPLETYFTDVMELYFNDESIQILHQPAAHTDGDSIVYFRRSDVISTGDIFVTTSYPLIDVERGGTLQGIIDALNRIIALMIPAANEEGGTLAISGHGRIADEYGVAIYRDMLTIIRDRIIDMIKKGMNLEQVKAGRPTMDYDGIYGLNSEFWSTERFIEAIYEEFALD